MLPHLSQTIRRSVRAFPILGFALGVAAGYGTTHVSYPDTWETTVSAFAISAMIGLGFLGGLVEAIASRWALRIPGQLLLVLTLLIPALGCIFVLGAMQVVEQFAGITFDSKWGFDAASSGILGGTLIGGMVLVREGIRRTWLRSINTKFHRSSSNPQ